MEVDVDKGRSGLTTKLVSRLEDIPIEIWNNLFPPSFLDYHFFKTLDESHFGGINTFYILILHKDTIAGIAPCFIIDYSLTTTISGALKKLLSKIEKVFPALFNIKILICGCIIGEGRIGISKFYKDTLIKAMVEEMGFVAKRNKACVLAFKDILPQDTELLDTLVRLDFCKVNSLPSTELNIKFSSFDEYLKSLGSSSRDVLKRRIKKTEQDVRLQMTVSNDAGDSLDKIYDLYLQVYDKAEVKYQMVSKDFFVKISENMKGRVKYFLWHIDNRLVAFSLCLISDGILRNMFVGFDYSIAYEYHLFFITFCDQLKWCLQNGFKEYHSGESAYEGKRRLGFSFVPKFIYAKHMNKYINPFFKLLCLFLQPENFNKTLRNYNKR